MVICGKDNQIWPIILGDKRGFTNKEVNKSFNRTDLRRIGRK